MCRIVLCPANFLDCGVTAAVVATESAQQPRTRVIWHVSPLFRLLPSSGYLAQMLRERGRGRWGCSESARAPVVHGDRAAAERLRRDQLEPSRAGQSALIQGRAVAGDPGVDEELVLIDQIQPVQLGREPAAA